MPVRPIDYSTMFLRLNELSKEQAAMQEAAQRQQALHDADAKKKAIEQIQKVNELEKIQDGPEHINDKKEHETPTDSDSQEDKKQQNESAVENKIEDNQIKIKDPLLGTHIDISG